MNAESHVIDTDPARIPGLDVARSFAILGMTVVHFSLVLGNGQSPGFLLKLLLGFLDGRAAATFVILAGVGVTLMSRRAVASGIRHDIRHLQAILVRRGLVLLALGFVNLTIWPGDILRDYGVSLLLASRMILVSDRRLLLGTLSFVIGFIVLFLTIDFEQNWNWEAMTYHGLWTPAGIVRNLFYDGFRSVFPWTGLFLFGMWLGRQPLGDAAASGRIALIGAAIATGAELISRLCVALLTENSTGLSAAEIKALFGTESMPALPLFLLSAGGLAVTVIAGSVRLVGGWPSPLWGPLAATGRMALTWYFAHIVIGLGAIEALHATGSQPVPVAAACGAAFFALAVLVSWLWAKLLRYGPLEWLVRKVGEH